MYDTVWNQAFWIYTGAGILISAGIGFLMLVLSQSDHDSGTGCAIGGVSFTAFFLIFLLLSCNNANTRANHAVTGAWEAAKNERATYLEVLHAPFVQTGFVRHTCREVIDGDPGCEYYSTREVNHRQVCNSRDEDGDCESYRTESDTEYTPWFMYEWSPYARVDILPRLAESPLEVDDPNLPPRVFFARHLAPQDWEQNKYCAWCVPPWGRFVSNPPSDWTRIDEAIKSGDEVVMWNGYHHYLNFFHVDDYSLIQVYGGDIPAYQEANVLPTINNIYSRSGANAPVPYDYDFVQFVGGVDPSPDEAEQWQKLASWWAGEAGRSLQASLILTFAPASKIPQLGAEPRLNWISSSKAWLMNKDQFGRRMLPKNLVLIGCAVDDSQETVLWCQMETGMFEGNNAIKDTVSRWENIPFTPESFFGGINAVYGSPDSSGIYTAQIQRDNGMLEALYAPEPEGFRRVSMGPNQIRMVNISPTEEQKIQIIHDEAMWTWTQVGIWVLLITIVGLGGLYNSQYQS